MGSTDPRINFEDVLNRARGIHGTAADSLPTFFIIGGKYVSAPSAVDANDVVALWLSKEGYTTPYQSAILLDSFTTSGTNGTGTALTGLGVFKELDGLVHVTVADGTSPTFDVKIDALFDGTTYYNIAHLTQISTIGQYGFHLSKNLANAGTTLTADAGAGTFRGIGFGDGLRIRREIAGTSPSFTARIWINVV